jgi:hypothetical protein
MFALDGLDANPHFTGALGTRLIGGTPLLIIDIGSGCSETALKSTTNQSSFSSDVVVVVIMVTMNCVD